jgi:hypothetical protein
MFEGASFIAALEAHLATRGPTQVERRFWGFDSFEGLRFGDSHHARLKEGEFRTNYERVKARIRRNFRRRADWQVVQGFVEDTLTSEGVEAHGVEHVAVALFDFDLEAPTRVALDYIRPRLREGSVLLFDEPFFFKGHPDRGEAVAFAEFRNKNPGFEFRRYCDYGFGGRAYVLAKIRDARTRSGGLALAPPEAAARARA